ncbi:transposase [Cucumis melo var. makuwa]|uniref:Transposase n=1 Tax=Cucumis melo var. makuwa TaxID=1194695 RepID=A0A5A7TWM9_CUCMM|nr:transposase [Cucumis melo var. makuwa]TYK14041.1 transposase [Cucumis melo var. makuwa]
MDSMDMELECDGSCATLKIVRDEDTNAKRKTIDVDSYGREDVPNPPKIRKNVKQSMIWDYFERLKGDPNDPRAKCDTIGKIIEKNLKDWGIERVAESMGNVVEQCCRCLFHEYSITQSGSRQGCSSTSTTSTQTVSGLDADFDSNEHVGEDFAYDTIVEEFEDDATTPFEQGSSEIDIYLLEANVRTKGDFDILQWRKMNSDRFEVLGHMVRDILAIPVSTVASESAFSIGGCVVDSSCCSLAPKTVEALISAEANFPTFVPIRDNLVKKPTPTARCSPLLNWVVDSHPKWKPCRRVFDHEQFQYKAMFPDDNFVERSMFHERQSTKETHKRFKKGECSRQAKHTNVEVPKYFLKFQELIMANNQALNVKLDKLLLKIEGLKNLLKEKESATVEPNENIQRDENDGDQGDRNNGEEKWKGG